MFSIKRRTTPTVKIGPICLGSRHPITVQSMTDTPTSDITGTYRQTVDLIKARAELVRWTINDEASARSVAALVKKIRARGLLTPIIGDFHYNGHLLLQKFPDCAQALDKFRINPGNVGKGKRHNENFDTIINIAKKYNKPVRIGVNGGSLDQGLLAKMMDKNLKRKKPHNPKEIFLKAMVQSALNSAQRARRLGLQENKIILSVKMSHVQDMIRVYQLLARRCSYVLHLGLTEAGSGLQGVTASSAGLAVLLQQGIGDTIRVSLTPQPGVSRTKEVHVCQELLQAMGLRYFRPTVTSCPGCGRTTSTAFQDLAQDVKDHIQKNLPKWKDRYPGIEQLTIAVMGCVVNGPGESKQADIGISLPGAGEASKVPVFIKGKLYKIIQGKGIKQSFLKILDNYIKRTY